MQKGLALLGVLGLSASLLAQAPLSYQRDNNTPMVAQAGGSASHGINPAGVYLPRPSPDTQFSIFLGGTSAAASTLLLRSLFGDGSLAPDLNSVRLFRWTQKLGQLESETGEIDHDTKEMFEFLGTALYQSVTYGIDGLPDDPNKLTDADLDHIGNNHEQVSKNLETGNLAQRLIEKIANPAIEELVRALGPWAGLRVYYNLLRVGFANPLGPIYWGLDFDARMKITSSLEPNSDQIYPVYYKKGSDDSINITMPINLQAYTQLGARASFAGTFGNNDALRWGISPHFALFSGVNHRDLARGISQVQKKDLDGENVDWASEIQKMVTANVWGINSGLDLGLIYNFGTLNPALDFLNVGLQIRDAVGFIIQPASGYPGEYSVDADLGVFLNRKLTGTGIRLFGGTDFVAIRGLFQHNPYSELVQPLEHLRLLAGISFLDDRIALSVQYYDHFVTPSLDFWLGVVRFGFQGEINLREQQVMGLGFYLNFRSAERAPLMGVNSVGHKGGTVVRKIPQSPSSATPIDDADTSTSDHPRATPQKNSFPQQQNTPSSQPTKSADERAQERLDEIIQSQEEVSGER